MTLSAIAVPSVVMRDASHGGTRPPWSGRSAMPERFTRSFSHPSRLPVAARVLIGLRRLLVRLYAKRQTDAFADGRARLGYAVGIVNLRRVVHDQEAARLQVHVQRTAGCSLRPDRHSSRRAQ